MHPTETLSLAQRIALLIITQSVQKGGILHSEYSDGIFSHKDKNIIVLAQRSGSCDRGEAAVCGRSRPSSTMAEHVWQLRNKRQVITPRTEATSDNRSLILAKQRCTPPPHSGRE